MHLFERKKRIASIRSSAIRERLSLMTSLSWLKRRSTETCVLGRQLTVLAAAWTIGGYWEMISKTLSFFTRPSFSTSVKAASKSFGAWTVSAGCSNESKYAWKSSSESWFCWWELLFSKGLDSIRWESVVFCKRWWTARSARLAFSFCRFVSKTLERASTQTAARKTSLSRRWGSLALIESANDFANGLSIFCSLKLACLHSTKHSPSVWKDEGGGMGNYKRYYENSH